MSKFREFNLPEHWFPIFLLVAEHTTKKCMENHTYLKSHMFTQTYSEYKVSQGTLQTTQEHFMMPRAVVGNPCPSVVLQIREERGAGHI